MAVINLTITFGKGEKRATKDVTIDGEELTLGLFEDINEAQKTNDMGMMRPIYAEMLGLTKEESRQITLRDFKAINAAMLQAANEVTNAPN